MQLVLSNNRVITYGENFLVKDNAVINTESGVMYENATIAECEGCPSDIDSVGYEYHAGVFVPCAPFGKGNNNGYFMEVCTDCATPRNSGLPIKDIKWSKVASVTCAVADTQKEVNQDYTLPVSDEVLAEYSMLRYKIKAGSYFTFAYLPIEVETVGGSYTNLINGGGTYLYRMFAPHASGYTYSKGRTITFENDIVFPRYILQSGYYRIRTDETTPANINTWYTTNGTEVDPLAINIQMPSGSDFYAKNYYNHANIIIELEGRK